MSNTNGAAAPLAWSQTGDAIEVPPNAALWRVRRLNSSGRGGAPEMVYGSDGLPLTIDIGATIDELTAAVERRAGKYRLDALDESRKPLAGVSPAYVVVGGSARVESSTPDGGADLAREALRSMADTAQKQTAQIAQLVDACARLINAVDSAGVSRRPPLPEPPPEKRRNGTERDEDDDEPSASHEPPWWKPYADQAVMLLPQLIQVVAAKKTVAA